MVALERAGGAQHVSGESDLRTPLGREKVSFDSVSQVEPSIEVLVHLQIQVIVPMPQLEVVICFREESGCPQGDARKPLRPIEQLAKVFGGLLRHAVDVPRDGLNALVNPRGRLLVPGPQRSSEDTRRAAVDNYANAAVERSLENRKGARDVRLDERSPWMRRHMGLVKGGSVNDGIDATHAPPDESVIRDRAHMSREGRLHEIKPRDFVSALTQGPDEPFAEMPGAPSHQHAHGATLSSLLPTGLPSRRGPLLAVAWNGWFGRMYPACAIADR